MTTALRYVPVEALAIVVLVGLLAAVGAALPALRRGDIAVAGATAVRVLLGGAVLAVLTVTMGGGGGAAGLSLVPGEGIRGALGNFNRDLMLLNLLGNVAMFVPVGLLAVLATRLRPGGVVVACLVLAISVEVLQFVVGRTLDVDDVLLRTLGGAVGAAAAMALRGARPHGWPPRHLEGAPSL